MSDRVPVPRATYRVQLHRHFTFDDARRIVPYLAALGVSDAYSSPILQARPGSAHGYDVVDHNQLNPEIGTREDFEEFVAALRAHNMGHILDIVPNHVGIMGADELEDYLELQDPKVREHIRKSHEEFVAGKSRPAAALLTELTRAAKPKKSNRPSKK